MSEELAPRPLEEVIRPVAQRWSRPIRVLKSSRGPRPAAPTRDLMSRQIILLFYEAIISETKRLRTLALTS